MRVQHLKYVHFSNVIILRSSNDVNGTIEFTNDSKYDIDVDQSDWNKVIGIKDRYTDPTDNSIMVAWRYYKDRFEVAPYGHDGTLIADNAITVGKYQGQTLEEGMIGTKFSYSIRFKADKYVVTIDNGIERKEYTFIPNRVYKRAWLISPNFGGNRTATCSYKLTW